MLRITIIAVALFTLPLPAAELAMFDGPQLRVVSFNPFADRADSATFNPFACVNTDCDCWPDCKCGPNCVCPALPESEILQINPGSVDAKPLVAECVPTASVFATNAVHVVGGTTFTFHGTWHQSAIDAHLAGRSVTVSTPTYTAASFGGCSGGSCGPQQYRPLTSFGGYSGGSRCGPGGCK